MAPVRMACMNAAANRSDVLPRNVTVPPPLADIERSAGTTRSPACSTASISAPGAPGTTPPWWNFGRFGTEIVLPPIHGTQPGTVHESRPIVLFQASATKLNTDRKSAEIVEPILPTAEPIQPGICLTQLQRFSDAEI